MTARVFLTLFFDDQLQALLARTQDAVRKLVDPGHAQNRHRPHVTMAAYDVTDMGAFEDKLRGYCRSRSALPIALRATGFFPESSTVYAAPLVTEELLHLHRDLLVQMGSGVLFAHHLSVGKWCPHCELAAGVGQAGLAGVFQHLRENWRVATGLAEGIGLLQHPSTVDRVQCRFGAAAQSAGGGERPATLPVNVTQ